MSLKEALAANFFSFALILLFSAFFAFPRFFNVNAQTIDPSVVTQRRADLESQLAGLEKEIDGFQSLIQSKQAEAQSLQRDIAIIDAQIQKSKLEIKARTISINNLQGAIDDKSRHIDLLSAKMEREKASLAELMRRLREIDQTPTAEALLSHRTLSDFFFESDSADALQAAVQDSFKVLRGDKNETEKEKNDLVDRKAEEIQLKALQEI